MYVRHSNPRRTGAHETNLAVRRLCIHQREKGMTRDRELTLRKECRSQNRPTSAGIAATSVTGPIPVLSVKRIAGELLNRSRKRVGQPIQSAEARRHPPLETSGKFTLRPAHLRPPERFSTRARPGICLKTKSTSLTLVPVTRRCQQETKGAYRCPVAEKSSSRRKPAKGPAW